MNKIDKMSADCVEALRSGDKMLRLTLTDMIGFVKKQAIPKDAKTAHAELTDDFVNQALMKYNKIVNEEYESIPDEEKYEARKREAFEKLTIVRRYAPQPITDKDEILALLHSWKDAGIDIENKKEVMPRLKSASVDMKVATTLWASMKRRN